VSLHLCTSKNFLIEHDCHTTTYACMPWNRMQNEPLDITW